MIGTSPHIVTVTARRDDELVEPWQEGDVIGLGPAKTGSTVRPVDGADELRIEYEPRIPVAFVLLAVKHDFVVPYRRPLRQRSLNFMQDDLGNGDGKARYVNALRHFKCMIKGPKTFRLWRSFDVALQ